MMSDGGQGNGDNEAIAAEHKRQRAALIAEKNKVTREFEDEDDAAQYIQVRFEAHLRPILGILPSSNGRRNTSWCALRSILGLF